MDGFGSKVQRIGPGMEWFKPKTNGTGTKGTVFELFEWSSNDFFHKGTERYGLGKTKKGTWS